MKERSIAVKLAIMSVLVYAAASLSFAEPGTRIFNVVDFGAAGDGATMNTAAIQRAVDACAVQGGTVLIPPGRFLTGSIELKSNVELYIQQGATLLGSTHLADYTEHTPALRSYNDAFLKHSLFYAERQSNIALRGEGVIDGQGGSFAVVSNEKPAKYRNRPFIIRFIDCTGITVEGLVLQNSAMWMQQYLACENVRIRGIRVYNHANKNNDMMDIDGCSNVVISDCIGDTDDDGITLKSTCERITQNVTITNCVLSSHCNALKTGTESTGGFKNIVVSNIVITPSKAATNISGAREGNGGIALTLVDGGVMDGVSISNVVIDGPQVPLFVRLGNRARIPYSGAPVPHVGSVKNISLSNITARNVKSIGCSITGLPGHAVENISLNNIRITFAGGVAQPPPQTPAEMETSYPESIMWGELPAYGFFIRHVKGFTVSGLHLSYEREDVRPALVIDDASEVRLDGLEAATSQHAEAIIVLENVNTLLVSGSRASTPGSAFVKLVGTHNAAVSMIGNDLSMLRSVTVPAAPAPEVVFSASNRLK
jgi:polygalacturonase